MTAIVDSNLRGSNASRARNSFIIAATFIAISDGFDGGIFGVALPKMLGANVLGITAANAGLLASAQLFGMLIGAVAAGILADRIGKRRVLLATILFYAVFTALQAFAPGYTVFLVFRVLAGIGIGGVIPTLIAHVSELSKPSRRFINNTIMLVGTAVGAFLTPLVGLFVLNVADFRVMFVIGGIVGLTAIPVMLAWIPESIAYLRSRGKDAEAQAIADRFGLETTPSAPSAERVRLRALFAPGLRLRTIVIMLAALFVFSISTAFPSWFPQYLVVGGVEFNNALIVSALMTAGMIAGCLIGGRLQDLGNPRLVVGVFLVAGFVLLSAIGLCLAAPLPVILVLVFLFGATNVAFLFNGMVANAYPAHLRGSILALDFGAGRAAAVVAAALGGTLLAAALPPAMNFVIWAALPLIGGILVLVLPAYGRHTEIAESVPTSQSVVH
jgi:AAHS family benzoate transporter-like MFS transporter